MRKKVMKRVLSVFLIVALTAQVWGAEAFVTKLETASGIANANLDFEDGLTGWTTTGTVTVETGGHSGNKYVKLEANSSITTTIEDIAQGSYTLSAWVRGTAGNSNTAKLTVSETGGPNAESLLNTYLTASTWTQMGHRNVLVYNGQMKVTISSGNSTIELDDLDLALDSEDCNGIKNWDFEKDLNSWSQTGSVSVDAQNADTGDQNIKLGAGGEIYQTVAVEPNTHYSLTVRAKVDVQDTFETIIHTNYRGKTGETVERTSLGNRVNLGVRTTDGTVLRQAPSGTADYSLVAITFTTGKNDTEVVVYANTIYDQAYKDSITIHKTDATELADEWDGNGSSNAYVDNFDLFEIQDENYLRGADVSFLPAIEDNDGKYFANGVQQDCLRILSNHGVNSITNMIMVKAGNTVYDPSTLRAIYHDWWTMEDGSASLMKMMGGGYFDKEHSLDLGKRATELGMSYLPSFHYSDYWMSNAKAYTPEEWLQTDYEGNKTNTDLAHMQSIVYNYVYDFMTSLKENDVNVIGVKHGNEQNGGIVWPVGQGSSSTGHALLIAASYDAVQDVMPGVSGYVHSNNGYTPGSIKSFYSGLKTNGAKYDGAAFSLYGGHASSDILAMATTMLADDSLKYLDYVNVETGFTFTRYSGTVDSQSSSMGQSAYYNTSANGQYNWLLDYMQAPLDVPNPYGQTRGFYYWETDWIPTPGAESSEGGPANVDKRTMFNNGDTSILEMGSTQPGKAGDMMDSMYAYLMRGCAKDKASTMLTPLKGNGDYTVDATDPTGITLSKASLELAVGAAERLEPTIAPIDKVLSDSNITYTSSDPTVASVSQDGFVCGVSVGTATVTATVKGGYSESVTVTVNGAAIAQADSLTLKVGGTAITSGETKTAKVFDKLQLTSVLSGSVTDQNVIYTSSNPEVASFLGETWQTPDGEMRQQTDKTTTQVQLNIKNKGTATITAATADGGTSVNFVVDASKVDAASISISETEASISYGRKLQLTATVLPSDTTFYKVTWESDNETVATVDKSGLVSAVGIGDATIRVTSQDNAALYKECVVHVVQVQVEGISLDKSNMAVQVGSSKTLKALISPSDAYNKKINWDSSDSTVASVDSDGKVTGKAIGGPVTITATTEDGEYEATCTVTVQQDAIPVTGISLDKSSYYFASDYFSDTNPAADVPTYRLTASVEPEMATNDDVIWSSDTPEVATVDEFGIVTAVSAGVAKIMATTTEGGFVAAANVYVPTISESFDNRDAGTAWGTAKAISAGGEITATVAAGTQGNILSLACSGTGGRSTQKKFTNSITNDKIVIDFDWNVGAPSASNGSYVTITDSNNNRYLSIQTNSSTELVYSTGGQMTDNTALTNTSAVGAGFKVNNTWYHLHIILNMKEEKVTFTIAGIDNPALTATHEIAFDSGTSFTGNVQALQLLATRSGNMSWASMIDNFNLYEAGPVARSVKLNAEAVKLIPIEGTLGASYQLKAQALPETAGQDVIWTSSDENIAKVSSTGLVTPADLYQKLEDVVPGTCTVRATSANNSAVYKEITITISNNPNASEFFSVKDEKGNIVYDEGSGAEMIELGMTDEKQLFAILTGGDGVTDIAGINWASSDSEVISINADTGELVVEGIGPATVTLTVTLYTGSPKEAVIPFEVTGEVILKLAKLRTAINAAKTAKTHEDDYYTAESLQAYKDALEKAEADLASAEADYWDSTKQSVIDTDAANLNAAVSGLTKAEVIAITSIEIINSNEILSIGKKTTYTAKTIPSYATEEVVWESSNTKIVIVNKETGEVIGLKEGTATITAKSKSGKVKEKKAVTVTADLTSWYGENGITITSTNTTRSHNNPFINARTMSLGGEGWTTGSNTIFGNITMDFGRDARIDNVKTCFWGLMKYTIDISDDGETWTTVVDHSEEFAGALSNGSSPYTDVLPEGTVTQYLRINTLAIQGTGWVGITILQANGAYMYDERLVEDYTNETVPVKAGTALTSSKLPSKVSVELSDGNTEQIPVVWNEEYIEKYAKEISDKGTTGQYTIGGTVTVDDFEHGVKCTVAVTSDVQNLLLNPGFENDAASWTLTGSGSVSGDNARTGSKGAGFMIDSDAPFTLSQTVTVNKAGIYNAFAYISGEYGVNGSEGSDIYLSAVTKEGKVYKSDKITLSGDADDWSRLRVAVYVPQGGTDITITMHVEASEGSTGTIDDTGLYLDRGFALKDSTVSLKLGGVADLAFANSDAAEGETIAWGSSNPSRVTVTNGRLTAVGAGTAVITASILDGNITASCTVNVSQASINGAVITLNTSSYTYDGTDKRPAVTSVILNGKTLTANDYTVGYRNNKNVGTATVTISGKGNYTGTATANFTITKASKRITVSKTTHNKVFGNKAFALGAATTSGERPTYALSNTKVAKVDINGKVTIIGCGTVVITIKSAASANYNAATDARVTLTVKPKKASISSASSKRAGRLTASWKRDTTVTGYEVYYSTNKNFKNAKKVQVKNNRTTSTTITKGLKKGTRYYVRVRSYTTVGGKTVYGAYSGSKNATVKR